MMYDVPLTCVRAAAGPGHGASRPEWWPCPGPGVQFHDERTGRPAGSAGRGTGGAGLQRGHHRLQTGSGDDMIMQKHTLLVVVLLLLCSLLTDLIFFMLQN